MNEKMSDQKSIVDRIKGHPIVALLTLFGAAVIGLASVTESLSTASQKLGCIPSYLGLSDGYRGKGELRYVIRKRDWVNIGTVGKTEVTGNHACYRNCKGEPTRTDYQIRLAVNEYDAPKEGNRKLTEPKLQCKTGPCGGWHQIIHVGLTTDKTGAIANFDVWSSPTSWELTANVLEHQIVSEDAVEQEVPVGPGSLLVLSVPSNAVSPHFVGAMDDGQPFSIKVGEKLNNSLFEFQSSMNRDGNVDYSYLVQDKRCG